MRCICGSWAGTWATCYAHDDVAAPVQVQAGKGVGWEVDKHDAPLLTRPQERGEVQQAVPISIEEGARRHNERIGATTNGTTMPCGSLPKIGPKPDGQAVKPSIEEGARKHNERIGAPLNGTTIPDVVCEPTRLEQLEWALVQARGEIAYITGQIEKAKAKQWTGQGCINELSRALDALERAAEHVAE